MWAGLMLSYPLAVVCAAIIVNRARGTLTFPLMLDPVLDEKVYFFDADLTEREIVELRGKVEEVLRNNNVSEKTILNVMLIIEDVCLLIEEKNGNSAVACECTLIIDDEITMILRDDGVIFDISDAEADISSLRQFVVAGIMEKQQQKKYLKTSGLNRNVFRFAR